MYPEENAGAMRQRESSTASELELDDRPRPLAPVGRDASSLRSRLLNQSGHTPSDRTKLESLDYTPIHNDFVREAHAVKYGGRKRLLGYTGRTFTRWLLTLTLGFTMGSVAFFIEEVVGFIGSARRSWLQARFGDEENEGATFLLLGCINGALALGACSAVLLLSEEAAGSGIPDVKAYLNGVKIPKLFGVPCLIAKLAGTIMAVSSGFCVGPEGPLVHLGATVGMQLTRLEHLFPCVPNNSEKSEHSLSYTARTWRYLRLRLSYFRSDIERRDFVSIGAATGFAAAFGAPVGGILFALEEVSSFWSTKLMWRTLSATSLATITLSVLAKVTYDAGIHAVLQRRAPHPAHSQPVLLTRV